MAGLEQTPLRIPDTWSATWFRQFVVEVLAKADARNAVGVGLAVTSDGNSVATLSAQAGIDASVATHNGDPFAHGNLMAAHAADEQAHALLFRQAEQMAWFLGD